MKTLIALRTMILFLGIFLIGCSKDSSNQTPEPSLITDCFQFKDSETDLPLEGVFVSINYRNAYDVFHSFEDSTDASGMICWEHEIGDAINHWWARIDHYEEEGCRITSTPLPNIVSMKKASYFKFIIKNVEPQSANDEIEIDYITLSCFVHSPINLIGSDIDTVIIKETRSGNHYVNWESSGANSNSENFQILTQSRDTTIVEIEY